MRSKIAFPLDVATEAEARALADRVAEGVGVLKIGLELFVAEGPRVLAIGKEHERPIFLDLKLHDIPETVERAVASAAAHGVKYLTVHAAGGPTMLRRAAERARKESGTLQILAVTVLTSMSDDDLISTGVHAAAKEQVVRLAKLAWDAGVRGFVCSPLEVALLRSTLGPEAELVVPGVRPAGSAAGDQKRIATPAEAIRAGANLLVIGRPIRDAADPRAAAAAIAKEIAEA
ncbi:MAG: orotidine-5'-phosphate decarboxylase [Polyangiales bacterium]